MRGDELSNQRPWRPDELVLAPEDLEQIRFIEDARRLQAGIAILNYELQRIFTESNTPRDY